jgi:hypothetical protein
MLRSIVIKFRSGAQLLCRAVSHMAGLCSLTSKVTRWGWGGVGVVDAEATVTKAREPRTLYEENNDDARETYIVSCLHTVSGAYPGILFWGGGQQIQLRTEDRQNGDLGAAAPLVRGSGGSCNFLQENFISYSKIFLIFGTLYKTIYDDNQFICH